MLEWLQSCAVAFVLPLPWSVQKKKKRRAAGLYLGGRCCPAPVGGETYFRRNCTLASSASTDFLDLGATSLPVPELMA